MPPDTSIADGGSLATHVRRTPKTLQHGGRMRSAPHKENTKGTKFYCAFVPFVNFAPFGVSQSAAIACPQFPQNLKPLGRFFAPQCGQVWNGAPQKYSGCSSCAYARRKAL